MLCTILSYLRDYASLRPKQNMRAKGKQIKRNWTFPYYVLNKIQPHNELVRLSSSSLLTLVARKYLKNTLRLNARTHTNVRCDWNLTEGCTAEFSVSSHWSLFLSSAMPLRWLIPTSFENFLWAYVQINQVTYVPRAWQQKQTFMQCTVCNWIHNVQYVYGVNIWTDQGCFPKASLANYGR